MTAVFYNVRKRVQVSVLFFRGALDSSLRRPGILRGPRIFPPAQYRLFQSRITRITRIKSGDEGSDPSVPGFNPRNPRNPRLKMSSSRSLPLLLGLGWLRAERQRIASAVKVDNHGLTILDFALQH